MVTKRIEIPEKITMSRFVINTSKHLHTSIMTPWWLLFVLLAVCVMFVGHVDAQQDQEDNDSFRPFSFTLVGDPQMGYGNGFEQGSYLRFIEQAQIFNRMPIDFVIMPGDLVHANNPYQWKLFMEGIKHYDKQTFLIPGNHDVSSLLQLQRYRDRLGDDYYDFVVHNCAFVMINSEIARDDAIDISEHIQQWNWLEKTLEEHFLAKRRHVFLVMHRPLYRDQYDEKSGYENWPRGTRARMLSLINKYNVSAVLTGHLHQTVQMPLHETHATSYTVGGTSRLWDDKGYGYRYFKVDEDGIHQEYQVFEPSWPAHWRFAGINGWVPAILKKDWINISIVGVHLLAVLLCFRTYRHWKYARYSRAARFWKYATGVMLLLGLNQAFSFNDLCLILGANLDYLPMHAKGGVTLPLSEIALLTVVFVGMLVVYYRYYIVARYGWVALCAMTFGVGQFILSLTTYEPWLSWTDSLYWSAATGGSCLLICFTAMLSAALADQKFRPPVKLSRPRQIQKQPVVQTVAPQRARAPKPVVKKQEPAQPRPVGTRPVSDVFLAAQFRSGRPK
jgi:UDP-2,3-diacylglucosamine pyrophosphatase LpxH